MAGEIGDVGYLKIDNNEDRIAVASVLLTNGYTVSIVRKKKNGKAYEYYVKYELMDRNMDEEN